MSNALPAITAADISRKSISALYDRIDAADATERAAIREALTGLRTAHTTSRTHDRQAGAVRALVGYIDQIGG